MKVKHILDITPCEIMTLIEKELKEKGYLIIKKRDREVQFNSVLKITAKEVPLPLPYTREELEQKLSELVEFIEGEIGELLNKWERELGKPKYTRVVQLENIVIFFNPKFTLS